MTVQELKELISGLAYSQGLYGRMKESLDENDNWEELSRATIEAKIKDPVDFVMWVEG